MIDSKENLDLKEKIEQLNKDHIQPLMALERSRGHVEFFLFSAAVCVIAFIIYLVSN